MLANCKGITAETRSAQRKTDWRAEIASDEN